MASATSIAQAAETVTYFHNDLLGSPAAATDESGEIIWRENYQAFGEKVKNQDEQTGNVIGYTGHVHDEDTGLTYMQARYYDPVIGRFYANDPVGFLEQVQRGNSPAHGFNRYAYANNNPYKFVDPDGEFGILGATVGGVIGLVASVATQKFTGDGEINWESVAAATITGAAVGATGGLAATVAAKIGVTGIEAAAAVAVPSAGVAYVGGATTQIVENLANEAPMEGVHQAGAMSAAGTAIGGVLGGVETEALTNSNMLGAAGSLVGGKVTAEIITTATQEAVTQATNAATSAVDSCSSDEECN